MADKVIPRTIRKCGLVFTINDELSDSELVIFDWVTEVPFWSGRAGEAHHIERYFDGQYECTRLSLRDALYNYQDELVKYAYQEIITYLINLRINQ